MAPRRRFLQPAVIGDSGDIRTWELTGVDSLAGAGTLEAHLSRDDDDTTHTVTLTVLDPDARTVSVPIGGWLATLDTDPDAEDAGTFAGNYYVDVRAAGAGITFPNGLSAVLPVRYPR